MENFHPVSVLLGDIIMRPGKPVDRDVKEFTGHTRQHWRAQLKVKEQVVTYAIVVFSGVCPGDVHAPDEVGVWMFLEKTMDIIVAFNGIVSTGKEIGSASCRERVWPYV